MSENESNVKDESQPSSPHEKVMSLGAHLDELRSRLVVSLATLLVIFFAAFGFANPLLEILKAPLLESLPQGANALHFTSPLEPFIAQLKVSFLAAIILASPVWIFQFWRFIEPALYPSEKKYVIPFAASSIVLFFCGISFCFFVMLPITLKFLIGLGMETATPMITISDYLSVLLILIFAFGIVFETPLIIVLLALLDLISADSLAQNRKIIIVAIFVISAILTPPDPISQIAMAIPTYIMFECSLLIIRLIKKEPQKS